MEYKKIVKQLIDLQKESFDKYFSATAAIQDQAEKLLLTLVQDMPGMNNGGGEVIDQWIGVYKKNRENFKKAVDDGFAKGESFFDYYNAMAMFHDQTRDIFKNWMPQDFKKNLDEIAAIYKNGYDEFKKHADENIRHLQDCFPVASKARTKTQQQK